MSATPKFQISQQIFDRPSGSVRGTVIAMFSLGKKQMRIAHATVLVDSPPSVTVTLPKGYLSVETVFDAAECLKAFAETMQSLK